MNGVAVRRDSTVVTERNEDKEFCVLILTQYQSRLSCDPQQVLRMKQPLK